jgi:hypothetical protein
VSDVLFTVVTPAVTVTTPNSNVGWSVGTARRISRSHNLGNREAVRVELSRDGGVTWTTLSPGVTNAGNTSGNLPWTVTPPTTAAARVRVTWLHDSSVHDVSNVNFRIQ